MVLIVLEAVSLLAGLIAFGLFQKDIIAYDGSDLANSGMVVAFITYPI